MGRDSKQRAALFGHRADMAVMSAYDPKRSSGLTFSSTTMGELDA
jgi:hypothetical protein